MFQETTALKKIMKLIARIRAVQGGTSAGKTIGIENILISLAQQDKKPTLTSIVSESIPHLKKGCIRDFKRIMIDHKYWRDKNWFETDKIYTFETGSQIEFFGADQHEKLRGGRRDRLFINECNNVPFMAFEELEVRTKQFIFLDWNPTHEFWFNNEILGQRNDVEHIILNYLDNEALDENIIKSMEQRKNRKGWWQVYGLGQLGEIEGKVYHNWQIIDEIPHEARLERYGLDFGYAVSPTAIVAIYYYNGGFIFDEICFQKGLGNKEIADIFKTIESKLVVADSAEPKSIDELRQYGINIQPAQKGQGSVNRGISFVQEQRCSMTKRSVNIIKEYRNYLFEVDKDGNPTNDPVSVFNHTMDAIRYALSTYQENDYDDITSYLEERLNRNKFEELTKENKMFKI